MTPHFDFTVLRVANVLVSQTFYERVLGLTHRLSNSPPNEAYDGHYVELETGSHRLGLVSHTLMTILIPSLPASASKGATALLSFKVPDLEAAYQTAVNAGAEVKAPPKKQPWGQHSAFLADPDGNLIELVQAPTA